MVPTPRPLQAAADNTPPAAPASHRPPAQARHLPAAVIRPGVEEGRLPERGGHHPTTAPTLCGGRGATAGRATPETADVRRVGGRGEAGQGKPGAELADMPEGRPEGVRRHPGLHGRRALRLRGPEVSLERGGEGGGGGTLARGGAKGG